MVELIHLLIYLLVIGVCIAVILVLLQLAGGFPALRM